MSDQHTTPNTTTTLTLPPEFYPINEVGFSGRFKSYIASRGFLRHEVNHLIKEYNLHYAVIGPYTQRIIFPIYYEGKLAGWTGRAITKAELRYKANGSSIKKSLLGFDDLFKNPTTTLYVTEGPFDALKLDYYGKDYGIRATCLFGSSISHEQITLLTQLRSRYQNVRIIFDQGALMAMLDVASQCAVLGACSYQLPARIDDPGDMTREDVYQLSRDLDMAYPLGTDSLVPSP